MPSYSSPYKNEAYVTYLSLLSQADTKLMQENPTLATGDVTVSIDGAAFANLATLPDVYPAGSTSVRLRLAAAEMNGDNVAVKFHDVAGAEWADLTITIATVSGSAAAAVPLPGASGGATREGLREEVARVFGLHEDVATGGTTGTLVDSKLSVYADDWWNGSWALIKTDAGGAGAAPEGERTLVTDFAGSSGTLSVSPSFTAAPASGDTYQIYRRVSPTEIDTALAKVCYGATAILSLTPSATTLSYSLSTARLYHPNQVKAVYVRDLGTITNMPYRVEGWTIEDNFGVMTLRMPFTLSASDNLWLLYVVGENSVLSDTVQFNLPEALVKARAVVYLIQNILVNQDDAGLSKWGTLLRHWLEMKAQAERALDRPRQKAKGANWGTGSGTNVWDRLGSTSIYD